jgi:hypothetical protein
MTQAAIAPDVHQSLDIHRDFAPEVAFYTELFVDDVAQPLDFIFRQVPHPCVWAYASSLEELLAGMQSNPVDVGQGYFYAFLPREVNTGNTCHVVLSLPLLVLRVAANDAHYAFAANDLAPLTSSNYGRRNLHLTKIPLPLVPSQVAQGMAVLRTHKDARQRHAHKRTILPLRTPVASRFRVHPPELRLCARSVPIVSDPP